jgi:non-ribosomal peptide synthetase component F
MNAKSIESIYPLSPQQQGMLFETLYAHESGVHIEQEVHTLAGDLDFACLEQAWQKVVDRHAILRTAFVWKSQDEPLQVVLKQVGVSIERRDWRGRSETQRQEELEVFLNTDRRRGFELSRLPLMRLALFQIGETTYQLVRTFHHILVDGWCLPILNRELVWFYGAFSRGEDLKLELSRPYREYLTWLKHQDLAAAESFWRERLAGFRRPTALGVTGEPVDPGDRDEPYGYHELRLPAAEKATLQFLSRQHHLTLNSLVQGVWALLLSRYSGDEDVLFGTTVSGRPPDLGGAESMIGLFSNTLPFRVTVAASDALWSWLQSVQDQHLELRRFEYCSAGQVHQWSEVPNALPLFESLLVFENYPVEPTLDPSSGFQVTDVRRAQSIGAQTRYPLTILAIPDSELILRFVYDRSRFDVESIHWIARHFREVLNTIAAEPAAVLTALLDKVPVDEIPRVRPRPAVECSREEQPLAEVRSPTQAVLADIWAEILGVERVSIHESFYQLGGHSLLATQIMSRVREAFVVELPLCSLFENPTVAGLAERIEMARQGAQRRPVPSLQPVPRDRPLPLSFAQQRLWFLDQLETGSPAYNVPAVVHLRGRLIVRALEWSLSEILGRHETLRTSFSVVDREPVQVIAPAIPLTMPVIDLTSLPESGREAEARRIADEEAQRPFDLTQSPLLRATLLRLGPEDHILLLTMHHIASDRWSMGVLYRELGALYQSKIQGFKSPGVPGDSPEPPPLPPLPIQYADYAVWQREWLRGEVLEQQLTYWKQQLGDGPTALELPTDRPRSAAQTSRGASHSLLLSSSLTEAVKALSQREGVTLFMTLLAAFKTQLQRYTGQDDIVVGTNVANRNRVEIEGLIGFFINQLVLRTTLSGNPSFLELLRRVREVALGAYAHQDLPFDKLVEVLRPRRDVGHTPLFQVLFVQNSSMPAMELSELTLSPPEIDNGASKFDLALFMEETDQGLKGTWVYKTDLFDPATIAQMAEHYQTLLESVVAEPDASLQALEMRTESEKENQILEERARQHSQLRRLRSARRRSVDLPKADASQRR